MKDENRNYLKLSLAIAGGISISVILYFIILRYSDVSDAINLVMAIIKPFVYGAVMAYLLAPVCKSLENTFDKLFKGKRKGLSQGLAVFCAILAGLVIITAIVLLIIPSLFRSISGIIQELPSQIEKARRFLEELLHKEPVILNTFERWTQEAASHLQHWLSTSELPNLQSIGLTIVDHVAGIVTVLKNLFLGVIIAIYLLMRRRQFGEQAKLCLRSICSERLYKLILDEVTYADRMFNGFFMGKLKDSVIVGFICFIGCTLLQYESPLLIAVIIGVTNIIPFFGPFLGAVPCALFLVLESPIHCLTFNGFVIILQTLDGNVIGPKILGDTTGLSSFWVLFSILFFGGLWGVKGMIVGVPLFAVVYDVIRKGVYKSLRKKGEGRMIDDYTGTFHSPK